MAENFSDISRACCFSTWAGNLEPLIAEEQVALWTLESETSELSERFLVEGLFDFKLGIFCQDSHWSETSCSPKSYYGFVPSSAYVKAVHDFPFPITAANTTLRLVRTQLRIHLLHIRRLVAFK